MESKRKQAERISEQAKIRLENAAGNTELQKIIKRQTFGALFELAASLTGNKGGRAKETRNIIMAMADFWSK